MVRIFKHYIPYEVMLACLKDLLLLVPASEAVGTAQSSADSAPSSQDMIPISGFMAIARFKGMAHGICIPLAFRSMHLACAGRLVGNRLLLALVGPPTARVMIWPEGAR